MSITFKPDNKLTFDTVQGEYERLRTLFKDGNQVSLLQIDLQDITHCDSAGLALLLEAIRMSKKYNVNLKIKSLSEKISALAKFCGVEAVLKGGSINDKQ